MPEQALRPLRQGGDEEGPRSPEGLAISALLDTGMFTPEAYHLDEEYLSCYTKLWRFCVTYQNQTGSAPSLELLTAKYPDFTFTPGVDVGWATRKLREAHGLREMRRKIHEGLTHIDAEDLNEAYQVLSSIEPIREMRKQPTSLFDHTLLEEEQDVLAVDVPFKTLSMVTGGFKSGELWYLAARPSVGKSTIAGQFCAVASKAGFRTRWISLEMPKRVVARRLWRDLAGRDDNVRRMLNSSDVLEVKQALDILADRLPAIPDIIDRKDGAITTQTVREALEEADFVILDHVGLLKSASGARMVDDHRIMAAASNQLREDVLATDGILLAIAHVNREGDSERRAPKLKELAESDWMSRDANGVITMYRPSKNVAGYSLEKNREDEDRIKWYSRYEPANARYEEIPKEKAEELGLAAEERDG